MSKGSENTEAECVEDVFNTKVWVVEATSECGLEELKICKYALNWASELSETKASCPMPSFAFSALADFLVLLASWSGAGASHTSVRIFIGETEPFLSWEICPDVCGKV